MAAVAEQAAQQPPPAADGALITPLAWLLGGNAVVLLVLLALQQSLQLPGGLDIEDLLGWRHWPTVQAALANWCPPLSPRWHAAAAYLLLDTALFMPLYGALILQALHGQIDRLHVPDPAARQRLTRRLRRLGWAAVSLLWLVDLGENLGGAQRIGLPLAAFGAAVLLALGFFAGLWRFVRAEPSRRDEWLCSHLGVLLLGLLALAALVALPSAPEACRAVQQGAAPAWDLSGAHRAKPLAIGLALLPLLLISLLWWFGIDLAPGSAAAQQRAAWRAGVAGVIGRSRYVLLLLALLVAFTLVLDQSRDVLLALASAPAGWSAWRLLVLWVGALAVVLLAHSCWLWTRLAGMVQRPGVLLPDAQVHADIGRFARGWARAMALAPLLIIGMLIGRTVGDATAAARLADPSGQSPGAGGQALPAVLAYLGGFGLAIVVGGLVFMRVRQAFALGQPADYYNSEPDVLALLRGDAHRTREPAREPARAQAGGEAGGPLDTPARPRHCIARWLARLAPLNRRLAAWARASAPLLRPTRLPLLALGLMLPLRLAIALAPETTATSPATLALLCLSLSWWCGAAGLLALVEQRQAIPWVLALLAWVGLLGFGGVAENHVLPLTLVVDAATPAGPPLATAVQQALDALAFNGSLAITLLVLATAAGWWCATRPAPALRLRWRVLPALFGWLLAVLGLHFVDHHSAERLRDAPAPGARPLAQALPDWIAQLPGAEAQARDPRVFLIASEGGGIRSAYWTAQVLARLHEQVPDFDRRSFVLSGVSGGAMGEAVYRACLRQRDADPTVERCVQQGFARFDALSPLIGGLMFDDALARGLPLQFGDSPFPCRLPGCGFLSRAQGFERAWMRPFPALAQPLGTALAGEPQLMLNSSWVESGNRAVLSTLAFDARELPASHAVVQRLHRDPSLIAAAHLAARFPFTNPIAALQPAAPAPDAGRIVGHLADGGYHENSGTESLADLWRALGRQLPAPWRVQLILIRNGQRPAACLNVAPGADPPPDCVRPPAQQAPQQTQPPDLAEPVDRGRLRLYADLLGPPVTLFNVSGVVARARQSAAALVQDLAGRGIGCGDPQRQPQVQPLDLTQEGTLVPLGWYLSPLAREAIEAQAARSVGAFVARPCG
ncbi:hypothetical protein [Aquabacterium sp.]|uniref:hypothetical protein n=1 Tax=Aquabacterium sp. TaxID=1872578 RepID=UPI003783E9F7